MISERSQLYGKVLANLPDALRGMVTFFLFWDSPLGQTISSSFPSLPWLSSMCPASSIIGPSHPPPPGRFLPNRWAVLNLLPFAPTMMSPMLMRPLAGESLSWKTYLTMNCLGLSGFRRARMPVGPRLMYMGILPRAFCISASSVLLRRTFHGCSPRIIMDDAFWRQRQIKRREK